MVWGAVGFGGGITMRIQRLEGKKLSLDTPLPELHGL